MTRKTNYRHKVIWSVFGLLVLILVILAVKHLFFKNVQQIPSTHLTSQSQQETQSSTPHGDTPKNDTSVKQSAPSPSGGQAGNINLVAPSGSFVSNHRPSLSGSSAPSQEVSTCNTTPGAQCYIEFQQGDTVKKLDAQTVDGNGSTNWKWDVAKAGFSEGSWQIKAIATYNGESKTTTDSFSLEVQP
jgi:hypothetical protein